MDYRKTSTGAAPSASSGAKNLYDTLSVRRRPFLLRAWDCAELSIPSLLPREGHNPTSELPIPWQSVTARGVNHLSSKLLMTMLPPNSPFFRYRLDEIMVKKYEAENGATETKNLKTDLETALGVVERAIMTDVEMKGDRVVVFEALKHLIVTGNVLMYHGANGLRIYHLDKYVVRRDPIGTIMEIVTVEHVDPSALPKEIREAVAATAKQNKNAENTVCLYTCVKRQPDSTYKYWQEAGGMVIAGTQGFVPADKLQWFPLRFVRIDGESYGRGYVEEYLGDVKSLEGLTKALVEGAAAAAKLLILVKPNGTTRLANVAKSENGAVIEGNKEDVTVMQAEKYADFKTAETQASKIEQRLSLAFLLNTAIQRDAERVTAEEIRYMAQELESALGGLYSILSIEFQLPYVRVKMAQMQKEQRLPKLPKGIINPTIVTGLEALGRGHDRNKLITYLRNLKESLGEATVARYINVTEAMARLATADGIDTKNLIRTEAEIAQADQQQQRMGMVENLGPAMVNQAGGILKEGVKNGTGEGLQAAIGQIQQRVGQLQPR
jgi:hypothetical protein